MNLAAAAYLGHSRQTVFGVCDRQPRALNCQLHKRCAEAFCCLCADKEDKYAEMLREVVRRTASLVAQWQAVGFVHGVGNTDNFSILGETIDYG